MRKIFTIIICFLGLLSMQSQVQYFTNASSGLIIREKPSATSKRIGKIPYGSVVELLKNTNFQHTILDEKDTITGTWVKIKFRNFPFIVSNFNDFKFEEEGYVFSAYIEKLNKATITNKEIDSVKFFTLYKKLPPNNLVEITSQKEIEKLLSSKLKWKDVEYLGWTINEILLDSGQRLKINQKSNDYGLVAYYPNEEILLFEGGHTSDFSISIKTGESLKTVGNPEYIRESPNKKFRLNGWFPGQECSSYFFQEKTGDTYTYLTDFGWGSEKNGEDICYFNKFYWINDAKFIYSYTDYTIDKKDKERYFIGELKK